VGRFAQIAAVILVGIMGATLYGMALAFTIGSAVALSVHHLSLPRLRFPLTINWSRWKALLTSSWPLGVMLLLNAVYFRIDTVILSFFRSPSEVGWYGLAYRIIESCLFLPAMFGGLLLPRLSEARTRGQWAVLRQYLSEGLAFATMAVGFVVLTLVMVAPNIILLVADPEFIPAAPLLQLLAFALLCMFFGNIFGFTLVALQRQTFLLKLYLALAICNTLANVIAVPRWGAEAAASITVATEALATIISGVVVWRAIRFSWPLRSLSSTLVATSVGAVVYFILPPNWPVLVQVALAAVGYGAGLVVTGSVSREQLSLLAHTPRS
jgi:O-antigen/teichoic acid export membrane protein